MSRRCAFFRYGIALVVFGALVMTGCATGHVITDPSNDAQWKYYGSAKKNKNAGIVLVGYKKEPLTPTEGDKRYIATTGFIDSVAFVAKCTERDKKKRCIQSEIALMDTEGNLLNSFGEYHYPELVVSYNYPGMILYHSNDGKIEHFPMFETSKQIETDGVHTQLFTDNLFLVEKNGVFGYINKDGQNVIPARYLAATPFIDGKAFVIGDMGLGQLDTNGNYTPEKYACMVKYDNDFRQVNLGGKLVDYRLDLRTQRGFYVAESLKNRVESMQTSELCSGGKWGLIDEKDQVVIPEQFSDIIVEEGTDYFYVMDKENNKSGFYTKDGKEVIDSKYKSASVGEYFYIVQNENDKYAVMDKSGKLVTGFDYDMYKSKSRQDNVGFYLMSEYVVLNKDGKWGVLDKTGKEVVPFEYEELGPESEGLIAFKKSTRWGVINTSNAEILSPIYTSLDVFEDGRARAVLAGDEIYVYRDQMTRQAWLEKERLAKDRAEEADREAARESMRRQEELAVQRLEEQRMANAIQLKNERSRLEEDLAYVNTQLEVIEPQANLGVGDAKIRFDELKRQRVEIERKIAEIDQLINLPAVQQPQPEPLPVLPGF